MKHTALAALLLTAFAGSAMASPLGMQYSVVADAGHYDYSFTLVLDNHDESWAAGQGWGWITFGDADQSESPLADFVLTSAAPAPFTRLSTSQGRHNGPSLILSGNSVTFWTPVAIGDSLSWTGTSATLLDQGSMLYSSLITQGGAHAATFAVADLVAATSAVPEPASPALMLASLALAAGIAGLRRRRQA